MVKNMVGDLAGLQSIIFQLLTLNVCVTLSYHIPSVLKDSILQDDAVSSVSLFTESELSKSSLFY